MSHTDLEADENRASSSKKTGFRATLANLWKSLRKATSSLWTRFIGLFSKKPEPEQVETPSGTSPEGPITSTQQTPDPNLNSAPPPATAAVADPLPTSTSTSTPTASEVTQRESSAWAAIQPKTKDSMKVAEPDITSTQQTPDLVKFEALAETLQELWNVNSDFLKKQNEIGTLSIDMDLLYAARFRKDISNKTIISQYSNQIQTLTKKIEDDIKYVQKALEKQNPNLNSAPPPPPATAAVADPLPTSTSTSTPTASEVTQRESSAWAAIQPKTKDSMKVAEPDITSTQQTPDLGKLEALAETLQVAEQPVSNFAADKERRIKSWEDKIKHHLYRDQILAVMTQALDQCAVEQNLDLESSLRVAEIFLEHSEGGGSPFLRDKIRDIEAQLAKIQYKPSW